jgi:hypothetical protein
MEELHSANFDCNLAKCYGGQSKKDEILGTRRTQKKFVEVKFKGRYYLCNPGGDVRIILKWK